MLIPIRGPSGAAEPDDDTPQEWSLLELNGELIPPVVRPTPDEGKASSGITDAPPDASDVRMELGSVRFSSDGTPIMTLGSHELKGKVENLKQPFVVMRKKRKRLDDSGGAAGDESMMDVDASATCGQSSVSYEVAGIVKKKMLFDNYPKSIMR